MHDYTPKMTDIGVMSQTFTCETVPAAGRAGNDMLA